MDWNFNLLEEWDEKITDSAGFLTEEVRDYDNKYTASCVKTDIKYKNSFAYQRIKFKGPKSVTLVH